jgi:hypothetical protein
MAAVENYSVIATGTSRDELLSIEHMQAHTEMYSGLAGVWCELQAA